MLFDINERSAPQKLRTFIKFNGQQIKVYSVCWESVYLLVGSDSNVSMIKLFYLSKNVLNRYIIITPSHNTKTHQTRQTIGCVNFLCTDCVMILKIIDQTIHSYRPKAIYLKIFALYRITIETPHSKSRIRHRFTLSYWWLPDWKTMLSQPICDFVNRPNNIFKTITYRYS